jgi:RNA polymerase sigma-70 factor, ECF subfamily
VVPYNDLIWLLPLAAAMLRHPGDGDLIERLKRREPEAVGEMYDRYGRLAYSLIFRIVRNEAVAEELLQEAFLRAWHRLSFFDPERGSLAAWLLAVARNQAIDYVRSVGGRTWKGQVNMDGIDDPSIFSSLSTAESDLLQLERARKVHAALEKLNPNQRTVVELAYFEGLSQTEMAERLGQPLGTVKTWVRGALKVLREQLGEPVAV